MYNDDDLEWKMIRLYQNLFNFQESAVFEGDDATLLYSLCSQF